MEIPIASMTTAEKLVAMEQLWSSLELEPNHEPPPWHREILEGRQRRMEAGQTAFSTLDEARKRIEDSRQ
jgi:hypothetical protein